MDLSWPAIVSISVSILAIVLTWWLHKNGVNARPETDYYEFHARQVKGLLTHVESLSSELSEARRMGANMSDQNADLMEQITIAGRRINELERRLTELEKKYPQVAKRYID